VFTSLAWSPDGRTLYSGSYDSQIRAWDPVKGSVVRQWRGSGSWVTEIVLSPDGRTLISGGTDNRACLWEAATGRRLAVLEHAGYRTFAFTPDSRNVLAGFDEIFLWDAATGKQGRALHDRHHALIGQLRVSADGRVLAAVGSNRAITLLDPDSGQLIRRVEQPEARCIALSADGKLLAASGEATLRGADTPICLWDVTTGAERCRFKPGITINSLAFSPRGAWLAAACWDHHVRVWDVRTGQEMAVLRGHTDRVQTLAWSPDGRTLATGGGDGWILLWDVRTALGRDEPAPDSGEKR
jgi:WD40 repeat protein